VTAVTNSSRFFDEKQDRKGARGADNKSPGDVGAQAKFRFPRLSHNAVVTPSTYVKDITCHGVIRA
jgi:hypothetical protein